MKISQFGSLISTASILSLFANSFKLTGKQAMYIATMMIEVYII